MCGYHYFLLNQIKIDECFRSLNLDWENEDISKEELLTGISIYSSKSLPYNNSAFWEILLCEKPVMWDSTIDKDEKSYAILLRFHHSLADGISLLKFMTNTFSASYEEKKKKTETLPSYNNFWVKIRDILDFVFVLLMAPNVLLSQKLSSCMEGSSLDAPLLSDHQIMVAKVEKSRECLKIIKEIKQKVKDTTFFEVLVAAISKSFSDYYQMKGKDPTLTSFGSYLTVLMSKSHLELSKENITKFRNMFSFTALNIPITCNNSDFSFWKNFKETLDKVKMETRNLNFSLNYKVTYGVFQILPTLFPESVVLRLASPAYLPLVITNLPGPSALKLCDDCLVDDIVYWIPCIKPIGMSLGIFSYDGRLQIALRVDKAIISNASDAQDIVDGIHKALIQLDSKI